MRRSIVGLLRLPTILCASLIATLFSFTSTPLTGAADAVPLGSVKNFSVLAGGGIFAFGAPAATIDARLNYGTFPSPTINNSQAFLPQIGGARVPHPADSVAQTAQVDLATAYSNIASQPVTGGIPLQLDGVTITPGVYKATTSSPSYTLSGTFTLDAQNDSTSVFIIKGTRLTTSANTSIISLINGARACNVYWFMETVAINSLVTLGENTYFHGNVVTDRDIFLAKNVKGNMRLLTTQGEVHLKEGDSIDPLPDVECPQRPPTPTPTPTISSSPTPIATTSPTPTTTATTSSCGTGPCPSPTPTTTATTSSCGAGSCPSPTPTTTATTSSCGAGPCPSPTPTNSPTPSSSNSPTEKPSPSPTPTAYSSPSATSTPTISPNPSPSASPKESPAPTNSPTPSSSSSPSERPSPTPSTSPNPSPSPQSTQTAIPTSTPTSTPVPTPTPEPSESQQVPRKPIGFVATDDQSKSFTKRANLVTNKYENFVALDRSAPVNISIPAIRVKAKVISLGFNKEGGMAVPTSGKVTGWFTGAPTPGELGPAIIVGHVDWGGKVGIFYDLKKLKRGDLISVTRSDGKVVKFSVTEVITVPKLQFPTQLVYGNIDHVGLRLITCGGKFDRKLRRHVDNIIVFAKAL